MSPTSTILIAKSQQGCSAATPATQDIRSDTWSRCFFFSTWEIVFFSVWNNKRLDSSFNWGQQSSSCSWEDSSRYCGSVSGDWVTSQSLQRQLNSYPFLLYVQWNTHSDWMKKHCMHAHTSPKCINAWNHTSTSIFLSSLSPIPRRAAFQDWRGLWYVRIHVALFIYFEGTLRTVWVVWDQCKNEIVNPREHIRGGGVAVSARIPRHQHSLPGLSVGITALMSVHPWGTKCICFRCPRFFIRLFLKRDTHTFMHDCAAFESAYTLPQRSVRNPKG